MRIEVEDNNVNKVINVNNKADIIEVLEQIDAVRRPFVVLEDENGNYIQCAGSKEHLAVEMRCYNGKEFKHYILGRKEESKVWHTIECKVGPIRVLGHEDLTINETIELFIFFYFEKRGKPSYNKRNITKQFN